MSEKIELPSGNWVILRDPKTIKVKDRKMVMKASDSESGEMGKALALTDGLLAMMISEWSFDLLPPSVRLESLDDLEIPDYDKLAELIQDVTKILYPRLSETEETKKDVESPFDGLNG